MGNAGSNLVIVPDIDVGKCGVEMRLCCDLSHLGTRGLISSLVGAVVTPILNSMTPYVVEPILSLIVPVAENFIKWIVSGLMTLFPELNPDTELFDILTDLKSLADVISTTISDFMGIINLAISDGSKTMIQGFSEGFAEVQNIIEACGTTITQTYETINLTIFNITSALGDVTKGLTSGNYFKMASSFLKDIRSAISMTTIHMVDSTMKIISSVFEDLGYKISDLVAEVKQEMHSIFLGFKTRAEQIIYLTQHYLMEINNYGESLVDRIEAAVHTAANDTVAMLDELEEIADKSAEGVESEAQKMGVHVYSDVAKIGKTAKRIRYDADLAIDTVGNIIMIGIVASTLIIILLAYFRIK